MLRPLHSMHLRTSVTAKHAHAYFFESLQTLSTGFGILTLERRLVEAYGEGPAGGHAPVVPPQMRGPALGVLLDVVVEVPRHVLHDQQRLVLPLTGPDELHTLPGSGPIPAVAGLIAGE